MDLLCLIKLLLAKEYIKEKSSCCVSNESGQLTVAKSFEFEYSEIFDKIKESEYNKNIIHISRADGLKNRMIILNSDNLEKLLIKVGEGEEVFGFRADHHSLSLYPDLKLKRIIDENTRFRVMDWNFVFQQYYKLEDLHIKEERILKETERKEEILDFLDKLP